MIRLDTEQIWYSVEDTEYAFASAERTISTGIWSGTTTSECFHGKGNSHMVPRQRAWVVGISSAHVGIMKYGALDVFMTDMLYNYVVWFAPTAGIETSLSAMEF